MLAVVLLVTGCSDDRPGGANGQATPATEPTSTTGPPLPGERHEIYPYRGARLGVAGVAAADTLKVRSAPGPDREVVFELGPTAMNAIATGHNRSLPDGGFWSEITVDSRNGWANSRYLLQPGQVNDITAELYPTPDRRASAKTLAELARIVARQRAGGDPEAQIVIVDGPTEGDLGEVTVDVVGLGDDSVGGERLHVFAERSSQGFTVRSVEATTFCRRGVTDDRLCV